jgi:hypothetical protein
MERPGRERIPLLTGLSIGAVLLLLWSLVLPSVPGDTFRGGWLDVADLGGASFLAALFAGLIVVAAALPMSGRARGLLLGLAGVLLVAFGLYHVEEDVLRMVYRNHPALHHLLIEHRLSLALLLGALLLPAGMVGRAADEEALLPRILAVVGLGAALASYLLMTAPGGAGSALHGLLDAARAPAALRGDVVAALLALAPLALLPTTALVFLPVGRRAPTTLVALALQGALIAAFVVLAAHVAKPSHWLDALPALKNAFLFAAGVLLFPPALGHLSARLG